MSIQLNISNSLQSLSSALAASLRQSKEVFRPVYIVTQTVGMNNWLKQELAQKLGIAANIRFLRPNDAVHLVFQKLSGRYTTSLSTHDLSWVLYALLGQADFIDRFPKIAHYYTAKKGLEGSVKRMALAEKIADLFDQYQIYRAPEINQWNQGKDWESLKKEDFNQKWQKQLWQEAQKLADENFPDKTYIEKHITTGLKDREKVSALQQQIPGIYFFGLSLMTDYHLHLFQRLSQHIEITFLFQNPAPQTYWYDDKSEKTIDFFKRIGRYPQEEKSIANPLLVSWGQLTQNTFKALFAYDDILNSLNEVASQCPEQDTLLQRIQAGIFHNQKQVGPFSEEQIQDGSITLNSCFSPIREVEVFYNYLVHLIDQKGETLSAREVVVMVTDIDLYASYIKAVFDNAPYHFNYTIADESYAVSDTISNALSALLSVTSRDFTSENVVGLLRYSAIREHFQIEDLELIRRVVEAANIRLGITGNREDDSDYISWTYGLQRIIYGLCIGGSPEYGEGEDSFFPIDIVEGYDMYKVVRFVHFVRTLMHSVKSRRGKRRIPEWIAYVEETLRGFIGEREENREEEDYALLLKQLEQYNHLQELYTEEVSYEVFRYNFLPTLLNARRSTNFASRGITFCSLIPMRSIPFKVVAMLGMNYDKFPRTDRSVSFNLMEKSRKRGDRDVKKNDKQLFLDNLLAAKDYFYLSYVGQSVKNNTTIPPSAPVDELLDFISANAENPKNTRENFIQSHPQHGFSRKYNSGNPRLYSYLINSSADNSLTEEESVPRNPDFDLEEIEIKELIRFLKHPVKGYYNRVLNIYLQEEEIGLRETERFTLGHLEKWHLKNKLLTTSAADTQAFTREQVKRGSLPLKNMATVEINQTEEKIKTVKDTYHQLIQGNTEGEMDLNLTLNGISLTGKIDGIFGDTLIRYSVSKRDLKYKLSAYIHYLAARAAGKQVQAKFITQEGLLLSSEKNINENEAKIRLQALVKLYKEGHRQILPFSYTFKISSKKLHNLSQNAFEKKIKKYFSNTHYKPDAYLLKEQQHCGFEGKEKFNTYKQTAKLLLLPVEKFFV